MNHEITAVVGEVYSRPDGTLVIAVEPSPICGRCEGCMFYALWTDHINTDRVCDQETTLPWCCRARSVYDSDHVAHFKPYSGDMPKHKRSVFK